MLLLGAGFAQAAVGLGHTVSPGTLQAQWRAACVRLPCVTLGMRMCIARLWSKPECCGGSVLAVVFLASHLPRSHSYGSSNGSLALALCILAWLL